MIWVDIQQGLVCSDYDKLVRDLDGTRSTSPEGALGSGPIDRLDAVFRPFWKQVEALNTEAPPKIQKPKTKSRPRTSPMTPRPVRVRTMDARLREALDLDGRQPLDIHARKLLDIRSREQHPVAPQTPRPRTARDLACSSSCKEARGRGRRISETAASEVSEVKAPLAQNSDAEIPCATPSAPLSTEIPCATPSAPLSTPKPNTPRVRVSILSPHVPLPVSSRSQCASPTTASHPAPTPRMRLSILSSQVQLPTSSRSQCASPSAAPHPPPTVPRVRLSILNSPQAPLPGNSTSHCAPPATASHPPPTAPRVRLSILNSPQVQLPTSSSQCASPSTAPHSPPSSPRVRLSIQGASQVLLADSGTLSSPSTAPRSVPTSPRSLLSILASPRSAGQVEPPSLLSSARSIVALNAALKPKSRSGTQSGLKNGMNRSGKSSRHKRKKMMSHKALFEHFGDLMNARAVDKARTEKQQLLLQPPCYTDVGGNTSDAKTRQRLRRHFDAEFSLDLITNNELAAHMKKQMGLADAHVQRVLSFFKVPDKVRWITYATRFHVFLTAMRRVQHDICFHLLDVDSDGLLSAHDLFLILNSIGSDAGAYAHQRGHGTWDSPMAFKEIHFEAGDDVGMEVDMKQYPPEVVTVDRIRMGYRKGIRVCDRVLSVNGIPVHDIPLEQIIHARRTEPLVMRLCTYAWARRGEGFAVGAIGTRDFERLWDAYLKKCHLEQTDEPGLTIADFRTIFSDIVPDYYKTLCNYFVGSAEPWRGRAEDEMTLRSRTFVSDRGDADEARQVKAQAFASSRTRELLPSSLCDVPENLTDCWVGTTAAYRNGLRYSFGLFAAEGQLYIKRAAFCEKSAILFGFPMPRLADHIFDLLAATADTKNPVITLENWAQKWTAWSHSPLSLAFKIYDIDNDNIVTVDDIEVMRCDREECQVMADYVPNEAKTTREKFWEELQWIFSYVCEAMFDDEKFDMNACDDSGISLGLFQQLLPRASLLDQLEVGLGFEFRKRT